MPAPTLRPAADPLDAMDRSTDRGVDAAMARQERADLPGERSDQPRPDKAGDVYLDAARDLAEGERDPEQARRDDDREAERVADGDPDIAGVGADDDVEAVAPARGADDDDPIDETERAGDDAIR
ncbi:MAG: hypothetical protein ACTHL8_19310 [Burkholderiaceae bacterium]